MSCIHYKFSSKLNYDTVTFDGLHISLSDLKKTIMAREKLKAADCDLQITNAQTKEEYTDDNALIPKNSSVIIKRIPIGGVKSAGKSFVIDRSEPASGTSKAFYPFAHGSNRGRQEKEVSDLVARLQGKLNEIDDSGTSISLAQLTKEVVEE
ncbi:E3 ubiquitin-protein ligase RBBP6-like isoform X3 [Leucoraja erinacea]|uniref:E3 ubiquitin-protein ligase RBBP6-like isoform X3 n=1 Tax=Leucoraja erinaceus TaxID=7782 RepID=UPI0024550316|nr:E3 ubiquitin-protein ligase RBBP6-like isoform X3 [Leucoraja erinacea]